MRDFYGGSRTCFRQQTRTIHRCASPGFNDGLYRVIFRSARDSSFRAVAVTNPLGNVTPSASASPTATSGAAPTVGSPSPTRAECGASPSSAFTPSRSSCAALDSSRFPRVLAACDRHTSRSDRPPQHLTAARTLAPVFLNVTRQGPTRVSLTHTCVGEDTRKWGHLDGQAGGVP